MGRAGQFLPPTSRHVQPGQPAPKIPPLPPWGVHARIKRASLISRYFFPLRPHSGVNQWVANTRWAARDSNPGPPDKKPHCERNGHGTFQHPPSPILARLRRAKSRLRPLIRTSQTPSSTSHTPCYHNATMRYVAPMRVSSFSARRPRLGRLRNLDELAALHIEEVPVNWNLVRHQRV